MPKKRVVVVGGGYAGMACISSLNSAAKGDLEIELIDGRESHLLLTYLHKTVHYDLKRFELSFASLGQRFGFNHQQHSFSFEPEQLTSISESHKLPLTSKDVPFDYLVIASGSKAIDLGITENEQLVHENTLKKRAISTYLNQLKANDEITLVGLGATGLQFLFEILSFSNRRGLGLKLRILGMETELLPAFNRQFHDYVLKKCRQAGIDILFSHKFIKQEEGQVELESMATGKTFSLPSKLTLLFPGVRPTPAALECDRHGRVLAPQVLPNIYACGDCAQFEGSGLNSLTAQAAVRKGKLVAENILNDISGQRLNTYNYKELGYFLSMGEFDGIGYMLWQQGVISGPPAFVIKEAIEAQFALMLQGVDLYF